MSLLPLSQLVMALDLEKALEKVKQCEYLPENEMKELCRMVRTILIEESNVIRVPAPVTVCGDVHGQFHDVLKLFETGGQIPETNYIFMGDFIDRGYHSVETLTLLLLLKARYPANITLIRGNHETRAITQIYGFYDECIRKYGSTIIWTHCCEVFDCMNISAVIDDEIFCVHGGLSPDIKTIDQIRCLDRNKEIPHEGAYCDLVWSDPEDIETWNISNRGAGWVFGSRVANEFNHLNRLKLIARAHQLMQEGYMYHFEKKNVVTVWSAPNYCFRCGNLASVMAVDKDLGIEFKTFSDTPIDHSKENPHNKPVYFL